MFKTIEKVCLDHAQFVTFQLTTERDGHADTPPHHRRENRCADLVERIRLVRIGHANPTSKRRSPSMARVLLDRLNFRQAAAERRVKARDTDIVLSNEILAVSQSEEAGFCPRLRTSPNGLEAAEAQARLASVGPNVITREGRPSVLRELWGRAKNPLNALFLSLATVSYFLGDIRAAIVIAIMVVLAITTAFIQEHRSNDAAAKLRAMVKTTASVKRRGARPDAGEDHPTVSAKLR